MSDPVQDLYLASQAENDRLKSDLAAHKAALADQTRLTNIAKGALENAEKEVAELNIALADMALSSAKYKAALADVVERAAQVTDGAAKICDDAKKHDAALWFKLASSKIRSLAPPDAAPYAKVLEAAREYVESGNYLFSEPVKLREALAAIEEPRR